MATFHSLRGAFGLSATVFSRILTSTSRVSPTFYVPVCGAHHNFGLGKFVQRVGSTRNRNPRLPVTPSYQETVYDNPEDDFIRADVISKVNTQIENKTHGRLFAIVHLANKQWKITPEDIIVIEGYWPPTVGDVIRLEKVLLVGGADFTVVGAPLVQPDLVDIRATVLEKRLSHTRTSFRYLKRKQTKTTNFYRKEQTLLRVNSIEFQSLINQMREVEGIENRIF